MDNVIEYHGIPTDIVSDRDPRFTGHFMTALLQILGTKQRLSTAFHPQTDGQTERMNRTLEDMLRHYVAPLHEDWDEHLAMAEFAINNAYQESIKTTPFRLVFNKDPRIPLSMRHTDSHVPAASDFANQMRQSMLDAKTCLEAARQRQKRYADERRRPVSFKIGDEVLLSSKNIRLLTKGSPKFLPKWLGPFTVADLCGRHDANEDSIAEVVAYKLALPEHTRLRFISQLVSVFPCS